jgi:hypothetical protein
VAAQPHHNRVVLIGWKNSLREHGCQGIFVCVQQLDKPPQSLQSTVVQTFTHDSKPFFSTWFCGLHCMGPFLVLELSKVCQTPHASHSRSRPTKPSYTCRIKMPHGESGEDTRSSLDVPRMLSQSANSRVFQMFENMGSNASGVEFQQTLIPPGGSLLFQLGLCHNFPVTNSRLG